VAGCQYGSRGHSCLKDRGREGVRRGGEEEGERGKEEEGRRRRRKQGEEKEADSQQVTIRRGIITTSARQALTVCILSNKASSIQHCGRDDLETSNTQIRRSQDIKYTNQKISRHQIHKSWH